MLVNNAKKEDETSGAQINSCHTFFIITTIFIYSSYLAHVTMQHPRRQAFERRPSRELVRVLFGLREDDGFGPHSAELHSDKVLEHRRFHGIVWRDQQRAVAHLVLAMVNLK